MLPGFIRRRPALSAFTVLYLAAAAAGLAATGNKEFLLYFAQMILLIGLILWADRGARFSAPVLWCLSVWGLLHMAGGLVPVPLRLAEVHEGETEAVLYGLWLIPPGILKYDNVVHAFGFFASTLACHEALRRFMNTGERPSLAYWVVLASAGMGLGAANEIVEFTATVIFPDTNVGGYANNSIDLVYNGVGAAGAVLLLRWGPGRRGRGPGAQAPAAA